MFFLNRSCFIGSSIPSLPSSPSSPVAVLLVASAALLEAERDSLRLSPRASCVWLSMRATTARHMCKAVGLRIRRGRGRERGREREEEDVKI
jgi:hypothetical protein